MATNTQRIAALESALKALQQAHASHLATMHPPGAMTFRAARIELTGIVPVVNGRSLSVAWRALTQPAPTSVAIAVDGAVITKPPAGTLVSLACTPGQHIIAAYIDGAAQPEVAHRVEVI